MATTSCKMRELRRLFNTSSKLSARVNEINIQMLSDSLHKQIFRRCEPSLAASQTLLKPENDEDLAGKVEHIRTMSDAQLRAIKAHLAKHGLWDKQVPLRKDVDLKLPQFLGTDIEEHFRNIANNQIKDYKALAERLCRCELPQQPPEWAELPGWVRYGEDGVPEPVDYPQDDVLVFDVEILVTEGNYPTMATAVSDKHWFSWCSDYLVSDKFRWASKGIGLDDLIPVETGPGSEVSGSSESRLVIGHNVAFDRSFVKEQYSVKKSKLRFLDTMSMHIAICGLTSFQRILYKAAETESTTKVVLEYKQKRKERNTLTTDDWKNQSSLNNLGDVHALHVGGTKLDKDPRDIFIEGSMADVRSNFQDLMTYCASDVSATFNVFKALWPQFCERFPHPVTLAGMFEMLTGYLPVNENWERYINQSNTVYEDMQNQCKQLLMRIANDACQYLDNDRYKTDPWLWDLDWTVKPFRIKKPKPFTKKQKQAIEDKKLIEGETRNQEKSCIEEVLALQERHFKVGNRLVGYPEWYKDLCQKPTDEDWSPGPSGLSPQTRVTPKLLRLTWDGFPLHYDDTHGWGYLVPGRHDNLVTDEENKALLEGKQLPKERMFPYRELCKILNFQPENSNEQMENTDESPQSSYPMEDLNSSADSVWVVNDLADSALGVAADSVWAVNDLVDPSPKNASETVWAYDDVSDKAGDEFRMGKLIQGLEKNPRDKFQKLIDLQEPPKRRRMPKTHCPSHVGDGPHNSVNIPGCWFFKIPHKDGAEKRVGNPLAKDYLMHMEDGTLSTLSGPGANMVLRLAKTCSYWKNNQKRIEGQMAVWLKDEELPHEILRSEDYVEGSSLGAIVPRIIPAGTVTRRGVESTWLTASNAYTDRIGSELKAMVQSPPGYCFVGADVDSQELWIGALLGDSKFGNTHGCTALGWMTLQGTKKDGTDLHSRVADTVGISRDHAKVFNYGRIYGAGQTFAEKLLMQFNHRLTRAEAKDKAQLMFSTTKGKRSKRGWIGGSESAMFNKLEAIAQSGYPQTPVLGCHISKSLEPDSVFGEFMTSRINWVVQSSAVDYLHLMLVSMQWLFEEYGINGRFAISIHDEVRYLVVEEDRHRAALALQITNLLTRSMFAHSLGMNDLPLSVAFFSAVDIDQCLRKEVVMDCVTPSNPHGLHKGYQIPMGEALDIHEIIEKTGGTLERPENTIPTQAEQEQVHLRG